MHKYLDSTVGIFLDVITIFSSKRVKDLSSLFIKFLRKTQWERFAELFENTVKTDLILEVFALLEDGNVRLSENGKLGVDLLLRSA